MPIDENDVVRLLQAIPAQGLESGAKGTVVAVYGAGEDYEVEFCDEDGVTIAMLALPGSALELVWKYRDSQS